MNRHIFLSFSAIAALAFLSGCDELAGVGGAGEAPEASAQVAPGVLRVEEREVERPEIFSREARGLWDGRISLGGRWVAIPEDIQADRVKITNQSNGNVIEGALFQRDANLPGPYFMVSMDAAQALGMTAGVPAELSVVAVRTETIEIPAPVPVPAEDVAEDGEAEGGEGGADGAATAAAAGGAVAAGAIAATALPDASAPATEAAGAPDAADDIVTSPLEDTVLDALSRVEAGAGTGADAPAAAPAAAPGASAGAKPPAPFLQVASGSNREGADAVARRLKGVDLPSAVRTGGSEGAPIYRVVAGPFETRAAYDAARTTLRELGYEDAFATQ